MKWAAGLILLLTLSLVRLPVTAQSHQQILRVPDEYETIKAAIEAAQPGAIIQIAAGDYAESITIEKAISLKGIGEVVISGAYDLPAIAITRTRNVTLDGLTIRGGEYGILVLRSQSVMIRNNTISESRLAGIKVRLASADIINNSIMNALPPYGKGIHITNTTEWPESNVIHNTISGNALEGIATNMALVVIQGNTVTDNGRMGIAVMEMTHAVVAKNTVDNNIENGIYVTDESIAAVCNNSVMNSLPSLTTISDRYGNGITIDYHSRVILQGNTIADNSNNGISVLVSSSIQNGENTVDGNTADSLRLDETSESASATISAEQCSELKPH